MKRILSLLVALALVGCASTPTPTAAARWQQTTIEMHWLRKQDVGPKCHALGLPDTMFNGCARSKPADMKVCEVYLTQPTAFDDTRALEVLGHEVWHCFGAVHN
jgi:hypothetical protein